MATWLLIDGYNLAFRSFYAIPELSRSDGFPTNAIHGWLRTLWYLETEQQTENIIVFFDKDRSARRLELLPDYKANRSETPDSLILQIPHLKQLTELLGLPIVEQQGIEADDLIASAALQLKEKGDTVKIVSADKDLAQIIQPNITQLLPPPTANPKLGWRHWNEQGVEEKFGVAPHLVRDYLALIGDTSDNIPGIQGVGPKTATKWLKEWGNLENIIANADKLKPVRFQEVIKNSADDLRRNLELVRLEDDLAVTPDLSRKPAQREALFEFLKTMEMKKALTDAQKKYDGSQELGLIF